MNIESTFSEMNCISDLTKLKREEQCIYSRMKTDHRNESAVKRMAMNINAQPEFIAFSLR